MDLEQTRVQIHPGLEQQSIVLCTSLASRLAEDSTHASANKIIPMLMKLERCKQRTSITKPYQSRRLPIMERVVWNQKQPYPNIEVQKMAGLAKILLGDPSETGDHSDKLQKRRAILKLLVNQSVFCR